MSLRTAMIAAVVVAQACSNGSTPAPVNSTPSSTSSGPATLDPTPSPPDAQGAAIVLTENDDSRVRTIRVGAQAYLRVSSERVWQEPEVRGTAIELVRINARQDPGYVEWQIVSTEPGTATIALSELDGTADDPLSLTFEIHVVE